MIQNAKYHSQRFLRSYQKIYFEVPNFNLFDGIKIPSEYCRGKVKLRISYNQNERKHSFQPYTTKKVNLLKVVIDNTIDYELKFEDRSPLEHLYSQRMDCDDILIVKNGWLTDSYYANICFWNGSKWYTPTTYLLNGTKRIQLLKSEEIEEAHIELKDLEHFQGFQLINAMLDFDPNTYLPIENVIL